VRDNRHRLLTFSNSLPSLKKNTALCALKLSSLSLSLPLATPFTPPEALSPGAGGSAPGGKGSRSIDWTPASRFKWLPKDGF
jgi:hypothetical protein